MRRLTIVTDKEGRRVFVSPLHVGDIRELERLAARGDWRVSNLVESLSAPSRRMYTCWLLGIDRSRRRHGILPDESIEDVARADAERCNPVVRELDEDSLWPLSEDIDLFDSVDMQQVLPQRLGLSGQQPRRQSWRFQRVDGEDYILVFVIQDWRQNSLRQLGRFVLDLLAPLIELFLDSVRRRVVLS